MYKPDTGGVWFSPSCVQCRTTKFSGQIKPVFMSNCSLNDDRNTSASLEVCSAHDSWMFRASPNLKRTSLACRQLVFIPITVSQHMCLYWSRLCCPFIIVPMPVRRSVCDRHRPLSPSQDVVVCTVECQV